MLWDAPKDPAQVSCALCAKEVPGTFIMLPNIKETIYLEMENLHQNLLLKAFDVLKDGE